MVFRFCCWWQKIYETWTKIIFSNEIEIWNVCIRFRNDARKWKKWRINGKRKTVFKVSFYHLKLISLLFFFFCQFLLRHTHTHTIRQHNTKTISKFKSREAINNCLKNGINSMQKDKKVYFALNNDGQLKR